MIGSLVADLSRMALIIPADAVTAATGLPFSWDAFHTLGGSTVVIGIGALLVPATHRRRVFALLVLGMLSHHALDVILLTPSGYTYGVLWPLTSVHPPASNHYLSSDRWPSVIAAGLALLVWWTVHSRTVGPRSNELHSSDE